MPKAVAVILRRRAQAVTVRRPRFSSQDGRSFEMFGDAIDASAVADEDRRLANLFLCASDVPGASRHVLTPLALRDRKRRPPPLFPPLRLRCGSLPRIAGGEEAAEESVAGSGCVIRLESLDWEDISDRHLKSRRLQDRASR